VNWQGLVGHGIPTYEEEGVYQVIVLLCPNPVVTLLQQQAKIAALALPSRHDFYSAAISGTTPGDFPS
jgi:hypothetical protein